MRQGQRFLRLELPRILATPPDVLSPRMVRVIEGLASDCIGWMSASRAYPARSRSSPDGRRMRTRDERPRHRTDHLQRHGRRDRDRRQLLQGSRLCRMARAGSEANPTGDRTILGKISKRGNRYLRVLFVQAAWVVLVKVKPNRWDGHGLKPWIEAAKRRMHHNVLAIALPTSSRALRGAFLLMVEPSRRTSFRHLRDRSRVIEITCPPRSARG